MMMRLKKAQKRLPIGGHHFREKGMLIKGDTPEEVVDLVANFRLINGKPIGDPMRELIDYYTARFPWMVEYDLDFEEPDPEDPDYIAWRDWIGSVWGRGGLRYVSRKEASMRWEICKDCPHNAGTPWESSKESTEFSRKSMMLRRGESVPDNYCYCRLHRADIGVSSFLESPSKLSKKPNEQADRSGCWLSISEGTSDVRS